MSGRDTLIAQLEDSRRELAGLIAGIPEDRFIYPAWRVKELLAHFAGWDDAVLIALRAFLNGQEPIVVAPRGADEYNARTVQERQSLPLAHIVSEWRLTRERLLNLIRKIPAEQLDAAVVYPWGETGPLRGLLAGQAEHERYHSREIRALLES